MISKRFQLLVIGNEILSGRRQDVHFANARAAFAARGLRLSAVHFLGDDADALVAHYRRALDVAAACGVPLAFHPEGEALLLAKYGADEFTPGRRELIHFPQGASLIPNPVNGIPGFSLRGIHCVPGFPQMAQPMMAWVLDTFYRADGRAQHYVALDVFAPESQLVPLMRELEARFPAVAVSNLPKLPFASELGFDGAPEAVASALAAARALLDAAQLQWREHLPPAQ